jgi:isopentenyldiphosphate isomerase
MCRLDAWEGSVVPDSAEVHAWRFADVQQVRDDMQANSERYTPWFIDELRAVITSAPDL